MLSKRKIQQQGVPQVTLDNIVAVIPQGTNYESTQQLAQRMSVSPRTIQSWMRQKRIPFLKLGKCVRFDPAAVDAALAAYAVKPQLPN